MNVFAVLLELRFDITESRTETFPSFAQCRLRVDIEVPCETGEGEEQIAEFMLLLLCRPVGERCG